MAAAARRATPKKTAASSWRVGKREGYYKATFSLTKAQFDWVRDEAKRLADERGTIRADASAVVRAALDAAMKRR